MAQHWFAVYKTTGGTASAREVDHFLLLDTEAEADMVTIASPDLAPGLALAPPAPESFDPQSYPEAEYDLVVNSTTGVVTAVPEAEPLALRQSRATVRIADLVSEAKQYLSLDKRITLARRSQWVNYIEDLESLKEDPLWSTDPEELVYPGKPSTVDDSSLTVEQQINAGQTLDYGAVNVLKQFVADRTNMIPEFDFEDNDASAFTVRVGKRTWNGTTWVYSKNDQVPAQFINSRRSGGRALRVVLPAGCNWMEIFGQAINFASVRGGNRYVIDADYTVRVPTGTVPYQANAGVQTYNGNGPTKTHTGNTFGTRDGVVADQTYATRTIDKNEAFPANARWMTGWLEIQGDVDFPDGTEIEIESIAIRRAVTYLDVAPGTVTARDQFQDRTPSVAHTVETDVAAGLTGFAAGGVLVLTPITGPFGAIPAFVSFCANLAFGAGTAINLDIRITKQVQGGSEATIKAMRWTAEGNRPDTRTFEAVDEAPGALPVTYRLRIARVAGAAGQVASFTYGDRSGRVFQLR